VFTEVKTPNKENAVLVRDNFKSSDTNLRDNQFYLSNFTVRDKRRY